VNLPADGISGIAPLDSKDAPSYVTALRNSGAIEKRVVGFFIGEGD
jgi:hypothetical protein